MSIDSEADLDGLRAAGRVVAAALRAMRAHVRAGVSTGELDRVGARVLAEHGARSGPQLAYGFPGATCISVNDEAVHGIPGPRRLRDGDLVKLDVTAELAGYYADACVSVAVGRVDGPGRGLIDACRAALGEALAVARAGTPINHIGRTVARSVTARGFAVCPDLAGHGIGRDLHEPPTIPNCAVPGFAAPLTSGLVITIEPIICDGSGAVREAGDGWTIRTSDGARSAHVEHTIVVTDGAPIILTA